MFENHSKCLILQTLRAKRARFIFKLCIFEFSRQKRHQITRDYFRHENSKLKIRENAFLIFHQKICQIEGRSALRSFHDFLVCCNIFQT